MKCFWTCSAIAALTCWAGQATAQVPVLSGVPAPSVLHPVSNSAATVPGAADQIISPRVGGHAIATPAVASTDNVWASEACGSGACGDSNCGSQMQGFGLGRDCQGGGLFGGRFSGAGMLGGRLAGGRLAGGGLGIIKPSDHCFDDFISPMTNPTHFEDPRTLTEARFIYLRHKVPLAAGGGEVNLFALQLRAALTERLSVIATKDGFITSTNPLIDDGWADVGAGLKYNLLRDPANQRIVSVGGTYEMSNGSLRALQGNGDGVFNFFLSGAQKLNENSHYVGSMGVRLPNDTAAETSMMYWSNHVDRRVTDRLYLLAETNWFHWLDSGAGGIPGVEGGDLFNFGSTGVTGNDILTSAVGLKFKPSGQQEIGVAWEFPITERRDVLDNRFTFDWIVRY